MVRVEGLLLDSVPRAPGVAGPHEFALNEEELNLLGRHLLSLSRMSPDWAFEIALREDAAGFEISRSLGLPVPVFMNLRGAVVQRGGAPALSGLRLGYVPMPDWLLDRLLPRLFASQPAEGPLRAEAARLLANVESLQLRANELRIGLHWDPELLMRTGEQARQWLLSESDRQRIVEYHAVISRVAGEIPPSERAIPLHRLFAPLFLEARGKSERGSDPIAENQALLQTLAAYVSAENIEQLVGAQAAADAPAAKFIEVRLQRRLDLAQHLTSTAAITVALGPDLALMLSTAKESYDARHRSGFSFSDLTANRVGVTLAVLATRDRESALEIQRRMSELRDDSAYMPAVGGSRDGISAADFNELYRDTGSAEYRRKLAEIQLLIESGSAFAGL